MRLLAREVDALICRVRVERSRIPTQSAVPRPSPWSQLEVEATVTSYFQMLELELRGERYSKTAFRNGLLPLLNARSKGAIERKHMNISAILIDEHDVPYVEGYKPLRNVQGLLRDVVAERLRASPELFRVANLVVTQPADVPSVDDLIRILEAPPPRRSGAVRERSSPPPPKRVISKEAENVALGRAGELLTIRYEQARLTLEGHDALAGRVEYVAETKGDAEGYDVLSFDVDGRERLIEVKTTAFGKETPFFVSANQVRVSETWADQYHVYRLFRFRKNPRLFTLPGPIRSTCSLEETEYRARVL